MKETLIFPEAVFSQCHASTLIETPQGLFMACFAGPQEGDRETGIWGAWYRTQWTNHHEVVNSRQPDGRKVPLWNPVLFAKPGQIEEKKDVRLYYRIGTSPENWKCAFVSLIDDTDSWSAPTILPSSFTGPIRNRPLLLENNDTITPTSTETGDWLIHFEIANSKNVCRKVTVDHGKIQAIQPVILQHDNGTLQALCRTRNKYIAETQSHDNGNSWSQLALTELLNPNAAIDAIKIDGLGFLLAYNNCRHGRCNLQLAVSRDGHKWQSKATLEDSLGEFSYPALAATRDGAVHVVYTFNRKNIKHIEFSREQVDQLFH